MNRFPQWFRTAIVIIVVAGTVQGVTAGSTQARPRVCNTFSKWVKHDNDMIKYWAEAANAAFQASAWDEYQYDVSKYNFYIYSLGTDATNASKAGC